MNPIGYLSYQYSFPVQIMNESSYYDNAQHVYHLFWNTTVAGDTPFTVVCGMNEFYAPTNVLPGVYSTVITSTLYITPSNRTN